jgi:acetate kinase
MSSRASVKLDSLGLHDERESFMRQAGTSILTINGGSSSIKFALYPIGATLTHTLVGKIDRIGLSGTNLSFSDRSKNQQGSRGFEVADHHSAANYLIDWLQRQGELTRVSAVGHRVVHGMQHSEPERGSQAVLDELRRISSYDPDHLPHEIELIEAFRQRYPQLPQVACFDTAFHHTLPRVARLLPIPRHFDAIGIRRYELHGLSYAYLMQELAHAAGTQAAQGRVILAHLGNGASLAAVRHGRSIDTSMGFTPSGGLPMGTRPEDLDPGVAW